MPGSGGFHTSDDSAVPCAHCGSRSLTPAEAPLPTRVVNIRQRIPGAVYIGRAGKGQDGYFGNNHVVDRPCPTCPPGVVHARGEAIEIFRQEFPAHLETDPEYRRRVMALKGRPLECFCSPMRCHGDVYVEWLESQP
jgi:hypothetical protein